MALNDFQQLTKTLEESKYILLMFNSSEQGDALAGALALKRFLTKEHKQVDIACSDFVLPKNLRFLPGSETIQPELTHLQKFILKVDVSKAPIDTLSYDVKDNWLSIYLTPKHGAITRQELRTAQTTFKYDLIITVGVPDLESLGDIFFNNTDLFYKTPIINIDHQADNERYGHINLVDLTTTSVAEIIYGYCKNIPSMVIDAELATILLTGMTIATKSFKQPHLAPQTLAAAGELVERGADREKIIQHLYRTRSVSALKLWGHALTHLQTDPALGLVCTTLTRDDFVRSGATPEDLHGMVDELLSTAPEAHLILILYEYNDKDTKKIHGLLTVNKNFDALKLLKAFNPAGTKRQASFIMENTNLQETEEKIKELIQTARK